MEISAIIAAAGLGRRFAGTRPKQFMPLGGRPLLSWSVQTFAQAPMVREIVVVAPPSDEAGTLEIVSELVGKIPLRVVPGGASRMESVRLGIEAANPEHPWVAVHDAARPLIRITDIEAVCLLANEVGAAILALPARDTLKVVDEARVIVRTLDREHIYLAQTPQVCRRADLLTGYGLAESKGIAATDEASLLELARIPVGIVEGSPSNFKITTEEDLRLAEAYVAAGGPAA